MRKAPSVTYSDGYTIGQVAELWNRTPDFVRLMITQGKLEQDDRKLVSNSSLRAFYAAYAAVLDA